MEDITLLLRNPYPENFDGFVLMGVEREAIIEGMTKGKSHLVLNMLHHKTLSVAAIAFVSQLTSEEVFEIARRSEMNIDEILLIENYHYGYIKGIKKSKIDVAEKLLFDLNMSVEDTALLTELPKERVKELKSGNKSEVETFLLMSEKQEGILKEKEETALNMLKHTKMTVPEIAFITQLSKERIAELKATLKINVIMSNQVRNSFQVFSEKVKAKWQQWFAK